MIVIFPLLQNDDHFRGGSYPVFTINLQFSVCNIIQNDNILCSTVWFLFASSLPLTRWSRISLAAEESSSLPPQMISSSHFSILFRSNECSWVWLFCNSSLPLTRWSVKRKEDRFLCALNDLQFSFFYSWRSNVCS